MEIWRAEPGDTLWLPRSCYPHQVTVTDSEYAGPGYNRIHWEADGVRGSTVLPELLEVDLVDTERPDKQAFVTPEREPEAEWDCADSNAYQARVEAGLEPEAEAG
jgi:hypothetical protein